ncbi:MAG: FRG domain-containing protein [Desulfuromonadaceae bacterium]|nr:FRG domain-containing protein [Desulfuromonadaceae bacterium]MDD5105771.1 FRG domain-containing protein [Desulfuromonadaceae bacterium]
MEKGKTYEELTVDKGVMDVNLSSWKHFHDYVVTEMLDYYQYIWRGQLDAEWGLETSLDRLFKKHNKKPTTARLNRHMEKFKLASRGRRGENPRRDLNENEWWAIGQHNSLATPLLDWTHSPFVALYFAFEKQQSPSSGYRAVWALGDSKNIVTAIRKVKPSATDDSVITYIRPQQDENTRLVNQGGLFTRVPLGSTVRTWIEENHDKDEENIAHLIKIKIPDSGREECLRTLNMMNINHATLFPDLYGASQHCNKALSIEKYSN